MTRQLQYVDGHYQLPLLWKNDMTVLPESNAMALKRLQCLKKRFLKNPDIHQLYNNQMKNTIDAGYVEKVCSALKLQETKYSIFLIILL